MSSPSRADQAMPHSGPWWKHRLMWLVVGGPAVVVVASFVTLYLAISRPDPVYSDAQRPDATIEQPTSERGRAELTPAMQARNHAATGGVNTPSPTVPAADAR